MYKKIEGFKNYSISKNGNVRNDITGRILKDCNHSHGYSVVHLGKNNPQYVHRLVAKAFICNDLNKPEVNHKDGNKKNNNVSNLEWVTSSENKIHAEKLNLSNHSDKQRIAMSKRSKRTNFGNNNAIKISIDEASEIVEAYENKNATVLDIAEYLSVHKTTIYNIIRSSNGI